MKKIFILAATLLLLACENREEPVQFKIEAEQAYSFSETANTASFAITGNIPWEVALKSGNDWCRITPTAAKGNGKVEISVTANTAYLQERTATMVIKAGAFSKEITVTQSPQPCPAFDAGSIASTGQTVFIGETPAAIQNVQEASGGGTVAYQWYKNGNLISNATAATYAPPAMDAAVAGAFTYTRRAKDNVCNTTFTQSAGSWVLNVAACSAGSIAATGQTVALGGTPETINSLQDATGGGAIAYQWYKNNATISNATAANYTPPQADANTVGAFTYTRRAKDNTCNTTLMQSAGSWVLTVVCGFDAGAIDPTGQTIVVGGTPETINSMQNAAGGGGVISYQWYKNGNPISGATAASYTPPQADANTVGAHTYTRRAKDNTCNTTLTQSAGSWILTVTCASFHPGAIDHSGQTVTIGGAPVTINSAQDASGGGVISYQWYKNGNPISGATATNYTPPQADANTVGVHTYTRRAKDNTCNTTLTDAEGSWVLTVICGFNAGAIDAAGQAIIIGGTPAMIHSIQDATGGDGNISYQWYKNGNPISGATAANYTPPPADAAAVGTYTYTRRAKDNACNTALTPATGSWVLTVAVCVFNPGAIATTGQTICSGYTVTAITSNTDASGGNGNITYQWRRNGDMISSANAATYNPAAYGNTAGTHTFTRWARDGSCNTTWMQSAGSWVLQVTASAQVTLTTGNNIQAIANGAAIVPIRYTTIQASTATCTGLPAGITSAWTSNTLTISGSSTVTGTHYYAITATGMEGCGNVYVSGTIKIYPVGVDGYGCVVSDLTLGNVGFVSSVTYVVSGAYGSQTWSAPVTATNCAKIDYNGGQPDAYRSDCNIQTPDSWGHAFSWCMYVQFATTMCQSPWRIPTHDEYCTLNKNLTQTPTCHSVGDTQPYIMEWGAVRNDAGSLGEYWCDKAEPGVSPRVFSLYRGGDFMLFHTAGGSSRASVRCVL